MPNETPQFIYRIAGTRPLHQWSSPWLPVVELPTLAAYLVIVVTREPDCAPFGQAKG